MEGPKEEEAIMEELEEIEMPTDQQLAALCARLALPNDRHVEDNMCA